MGRSKSGVSMCGPDPCSVDSPCLHGAVLDLPPPHLTWPRCLDAGAGAWPWLETLGQVPTDCGVTVWQLPKSHALQRVGVIGGQLPHSRASSGGQNHGQRQRRGMRQSAAGCLASTESGSQQKQSAGLWVRPWQEGGKAGVTPELCCRVYCRVVWADTIRIPPSCPRLWV